MTIRLIATLALGISLGAAGMRLVAAPAAQQARQGEFTKEDYIRWMKELTNWGRWGKDDEIGAMNLVTPSKKKQAAALVKSGVSVSLAEIQHPNQDPPNSPYTGAPYKAVWKFRDDYEKWASTEMWTNPPAEDLALGSHGGRSHMDALAHNFFNGQFYNGMSWREISTQKGATKGGIQNLRHGVVTRGILMDIPRLKGVPYLQKNERVYISDLEAWEKKAGVKVGPGDALFIRVGHWARRRAGDTSTDTPGLDPSVCPWLKQRDIALMGAESGNEITPLPYTGGPIPLRPGQTKVQGDITNSPVHYYALIAMGVHIMDQLDLDELAEVAARQNRWEFMLVAAPLPIVGGTGSPINPIAIF